MANLSFDELSELYKSDPIAFEKKRKELIDEVIMSAPVDKRAKLRILQMECDAIRETHSEIEATEEISRMMIAKANELIAPLEQLRSIIKDL